MSVIEKLELRKKIRETHDEVWGKLREKFEVKSFPTQKMKDETHKVRTSDGSHWHEKNKHQTTHYSLYEPTLEFYGIDWSYDYCHECREVVKQKGVLTNQIESVAVVKDFLNQPQKVTVAPHEVADFFGQGVTNE